MPLHSCLAAASLGLNPCVHCAGCACDAPCGPGMDLQHFHDNATVNTLLGAGLDLVAAVGDRRDRGLWNAGDAGAAPGGELFAGCGATQEQHANGLGRSGIINSQAIAKRKVKKLNVDFLVRLLSEKRHIIILY